MEQNATFHTAVFDSVGELEGGALARLHGAIQDGVLAITIITTTMVLLDGVLLHAPVIASYIAALLLVLHAGTEVEGASGRALELDFLAVGVEFEGKPSEAGTARFDSSICFTLIHSTKTKARIPSFDESKAITPIIQSSISSRIIVRTSEAEMDDAIEVFVITLQASGAAASLVGHGDFAGGGGGGGATFDFGLTTGAAVGGTGPGDADGQGEDGDGKLHGCFFVKA